MMKVLHDMDFPYPNRRWALTRGIQLILYVLSNKIRPLRRLPIVKRVYSEAYESAITLAKLDRLLGVEGVFGVRDNVVEKFPTIEADIIEHKSEFRRHVHVGEPPGPNRKRFWIPTHIQRRSMWGYDTLYKNCGGNIPKLILSELPIFHVDFPDVLSLYIDYLYWVLIDGGKIYS